MKPRTFSIFQIDFFFSCQSVNHFCATNCRLCHKLTNHIPFPFFLFSILQSRYFDYEDDEDYDDSDDDDDDFITVFWVRENFFLSYSIFYLSTFRQYHAKKNENVLNKFIINNNNQHRQNHRALSLHSVFVD